MENLLSRAMYGANLSQAIETLGSISIGIANRWMLGWPAAVELMLQDGNYFESLRAQVDQEKAVLCAEGNMSHLSPSEILSVHEISKAPPCYVWD